MRLPVVFAAVVLFAGPLQAQRKDRKCGGEPRDTAVGRLTVFRECEVDVAARVTSELRPNFRPATTAANRCYRAELEFVVDTLGHPETATAQVVSGNDADFTQAVLAALPTLRYDPAKHEGQPVRQRVRYKSSLGTKVVVVRAGEMPDPGRAPLC